MSTLCIQEPLEENVLLTILGKLSSMCENRLRISRGHLNTTSTVVRIA